MLWDSEKEEYYFSVVDVIRALTDSNIPRNYWSDLKRKLKQEGSQLHENIVQLKMKSQKDGKYKYIDTYLGEERFIGEEAVFVDNAQDLEI